MERCAGTRLYLWILLAVTATGLTACSQFNLYGQFQPLSTSAAAANGSSGSSTAPLAISPSVVGVFVGGTANFTASGGTSPYTFTVLGGGVGGSVNSSGVYTAPAEGGTDTVQVSDKAGLISNATVTVVAAPQLQISPAALTLNTGSTFQFAATGGVPSYTYTLSAGSGTITSTGSYTAPGSAGSDSVQVSDSGIQTSTATVSIVSSGSGTTLAVTPASPSIPEGGAMTFAGSGGSPPYTFSVSSGTSSTSGQLMTYTAPAAAGSATVTVADSAGGAATTSVTILPAAPSKLAATVISGQEIDLSWANNSADANGISIWRAQSGGTFVLLAKMGSKTTTYADTSVSSSTVYVYALKATANLSGGITLTSDYSNEALGTTP